MAERISELYPLRFEPTFRRYLWGGRRLETVLHKPIGGGDDYAESWEIVDHGDDQSVVAAGPLAGATLHQLVTHHGEQLLGNSKRFDQFPLLFKFLDCNRNLSVQVHPDDAAGALLDPPDLGKTEAWVILHADPGALVYAGLKEGVDRQMLERAVSDRRMESCLHRFEPQAGDCIFIPAGTVHALGEGLLVAEIQQASDTTFRLFDWNRVGADGKSRELHIEAGMAVIDFDRGPVAVQAPQETDQASVQRLVECDKFILERRTLSGNGEIATRGRFHILAVLSGQISLGGDPSDKPLSAGQTALVPASVSDVAIGCGEPTVLLDMYLPE